MAQINEPAPIAPVLPANKGNTERRPAPRQRKPEERQHEQRRRDRGDGHHVDEYA